MMLEMAHAQDPHAIAWATASWGSPNAEVTAAKNDAPERRRRRLCDPQRTASIDWDP